MLVHTVQDIVTTSLKVCRVVASTSCKRDASGGQKSVIICQHGVPSGDGNVILSDTKLSRGNDCLCPFDGVSKIQSIAPQRGKTSTKCPYDLMSLLNASPRD